MYFYNRRTEWADEEISFLNIVTGPQCLPPTSTVHYSLVAILSNRIYCLKSFGNHEIAEAFLTILENCFRFDELGG